MVDLVSLSLRVKDLLGPVTRVQKKKKDRVYEKPERAHPGGSPLHRRDTSLIRNCLLLGPYGRTMPRALRWP